MLRSMFRVVVVAVVVFGFTIAAVPSAQARPNSAKPVVSSDVGLLQAAVAWMKGLAGGNKPKRQKQTAKSSSTGPCIDPMGRERPCWYS